SAPIDSRLVQDVRQKYSLSQKRYFIAFGATGPRKALDLTLGATLLYRKQGGQASLVLIVGREHRVAVHQLVSEMKLNDVFMLSDLDSVERDSLYKGASALLFPSRCEGFGYPLVEAMRQGCPPIAWIEGPAKEIVGSVSPLVAHLEAREIAAKMSFFESLATE